MQDSNEPLQKGQIRVTDTEPITGENGDFRIAAKHHSEIHGRVITHSFIFEFDRRQTSDGEQIDAYFVTWTPNHHEALFLEDLEVIGYVEQYLQHHGLDHAWQLLGDAMHRPLDGEGESFEADAPLQIE